LQIDRSDPAAAWLAGVSVADGAQRLVALEAAPQKTVEVRLAQARAAVDAASFAAAGSFIDALLAENPWEWRAVWLAGLSALAQDHPDDAETAFNTVLSQVPGELAPKLALALSCEKAGAGDVAEQLYAACAATDANYVAPAAFGLARTRATRADIAGALAALDLVGPASGAYITARRQRAELLTESQGGLEPLAQAAASIEHVAIDPRDRQAILVRLFTAALSEVQRAGNKPSMRIANVAATEPDLRTAAEGAYRQLAMLTSDPDERIRFVDSANAIRPRTLV
jgi:serine/threonine-protein kinase PknG